MLREKWSKLKWWARALELVYWWTLELNQKSFSDFEITRWASQYFWKHIRHRIQRKRNFNPTTAISSYRQASSTATTPEVIEACQLSFVDLTATAKEKDVWRRQWSSRCSGIGFLLSEEEELWVWLIVQFDIGAEIEGKLVSEVKTSVDFSFSLKFTEKYSSAAKTSIANGLIAMLVNEAWFIFTQRQSATFPLKLSNVAESQEGTASRQRFKKRNQWCELFRDQFRWTRLGNLSEMHLNLPVDWSNLQ